ncbi:P-type conjugative transfer ATPase TrbB [Acinetobacter soli]|uniref:P-type conjugative transfer ATPase TrbB n=1 Tax=Acinetobacter soli TaxID=487316 RepID=UPI00125D9388|nr:P-type conjugative transfer ATPase TrbB [Acinetobacter soli]
MVTSDANTLRVLEKLKREMGSQILDLLNQDDVVEIMLNPDGRLWCERIGANMECIGEMSAPNAISMMNTIAKLLDTVITSEHPILECELPIDGSRFEGVIPPVVLSPTFALRKKAKKIFTLDDYVRDEIMDENQKNLIIDAVNSRKNILVVGGTGTGKTTLTNAIIDSVANLHPEHRLVIIEDTNEIQCKSENAVVMRSNINISMLALLKVTMRMRPDRILVGEVRGGGETLALLKAWNTGHPGGIATVHANDSRAGLIRMEQLINEVSANPMQQLIAEAVNVVVCIVKTPTGRKIKEIITVDSFKNGDYLFSTYS